MQRGAIGGFVAFLVLVASATGAMAQTLPDVIAARLSTTPERARLVLDLSATTEFAIVSLDDPQRIAVDVKAANSSITTPPTVAGTGIVTAVTVMMAEGGRARAELVLSSPAVVQQAYVLEPIGDQPARLVVDLIPTTAEDFAARAAADLANAISRGVPDAITPSEAPASEPGLDPSSEAPSSSEPVAEAAPTGSRPLIVLDPGHGGFDSGAEVPGGIREKDITLAFALQLRDLLVQSGRFDVALTRDDDTYLTLNERVDLARQNKADLFISLHADTFQETDIRGASIYTRDERATDILDKVLADGENHRDIVAGYVQADVKPAVVDILVDLMRRQVRQQAYVAAGDIVKAMQPSVTLRRFPVRQADFFVLQAPDIPSMLIELGFMSNSADIRNLESTNWRNNFVDAIAKGVGAYFAEPKT
ncbi:MAG: N-acetylmuramoyl-L-alanine amidase [Devosia sp.]|nr:N-acetylmuramoyl-L-alanine amidase [Devosia sp.]